MTSSENLKKDLEKSLNLIKNASNVLKHSYDKCNRLPVKLNINYTYDELEHIEALTSRFARLSDLLIQKIFRTIDQLDLESDGTVRDRINHAEKKGLIARAEDFIDVRLLRNDIAHEYLPQELNRVFQKALLLTPSLLESVEKTLTYCLKYQG